MEALSASALRYVGTLLNPERLGGKNAAHGSKGLTPQLVLVQVKRVLLLHKTGQIRPQCISRRTTMGSSICGPHLPSPPNGSTAPPPPQKLLYLNRTERRWRKHSGQGGGSGDGGGEGRGGEEEGRRRFGAAPNFISLSFSGKAGCGGGGRRDVIL